MTTYYNKTERTKVRRRSGRGNYRRSTIHAILDEGIVGHVGVVGDGGQPFVIPVLYARDGDRVYLHGSPLSRLLSTLAEGVPMCLTVTLMDGLVLARSAFHHSMNYRSVVILGEGEKIEDPERKDRALRALVEHIVPGRSDDARGPSRKELKATEVIELEIDEASAKIRTGPPGDASADMDLPVWAGVVPITTSFGEPVADVACSTPAPEYVRAYARPA
jgi:nitroimidazol reductase NimA-like FMN-containing flavoprotein (pyridoxamine 5'-phosphate oxidase superfamily)